jgi:hypothetical protein
MSSRRNFVVVFPSHLLMDLASTHFVNLLTATRRWVYLLGAVLNQPTISSPQTANGQVIGMVFSS